MKMTDKIFLSGIILYPLNFMGQLKLFLSPVSIIIPYNLHNYLLRNLASKFDHADNWW